MSEIKDVEAAAQGARPSSRSWRSSSASGCWCSSPRWCCSYGFDNHALDWWPQPHGFIYIVYLVATANLGFKVGWSLGRMVLVMLAGVVPFLSFWAERKVAGETEARLAAARR